MIIMSLRPFHRTAYNTIRYKSSFLNTTPVTLKFKSKVPCTPIIIQEQPKPERTRIDNSTIALLERLSLVKFDNQEGTKILEDAIEFADNILHVDTDNVEPLYTVLKDSTLYLRPDEITAGNCQKEVLQNAVVIEEDYFVAPPGNIPLHSIQSEDEAITPLKKKN